MYTTTTTPTSQVSFDDPVPLLFVPHLFFPLKGFWTRHLHSARLTVRAFQSHECTGCINDVLVWHFVFLTKGGSEFAKRVNCFNGMGIDKVQLVAHFFKGVFGFDNLLIPSADLVRKLCWLVVRHFLNRGFVERFRKVAIVSHASRVSDLKDALIILHIPVGFALMNNLLDDSTFGAYEMRGAVFVIIVTTILAHKASLGSDGCLVSIGRRCTADQLDSSLHSLKAGLGAEMLHDHHLHQVQRHCAGKRVG